MLIPARFSLAVVIAMASLYVGATLMQEKRIRYYGNADFSEQGSVLLYKGKPFTGVTIETFPDGSTFRSTTFKAGIKEGLSEEFGTTGAIRARWTFVNGKKEGLQRGWFIEGPRKFERNYKDGLLDGLSTEWYRNGGVARQQTYVSGVESAQKVLYPTGEIFSNYVIHEKRRYGLNSGQLCMDFKKDGEI